MSNFFQDIVDDLQIDPREHVIERYGHWRYYITHECPVCEQSIVCKVPLCRLESTIECLPCLQTELLSDVERFSKEAREFIQTSLPTDAQTLMWWKALRSEIDGKLKGLGERAGELARRLSAEVKA